MTDIRASKLGEPRLHVIKVQEPLMTKHGIVRLHSVPLREHKPIPIRVIHGFWRDIEMPQIQRHQYVDDRHIPSDMSAPTRHNDVHAVLPKIPPQDFHVSKGHGPRLNHSNILSI